MNEKLINDIEYLLNSYRNSDFNYESAQHRVLRLTSETIIKKVLTNSDYVLLLKSAIEEFINSGGCLCGHGEWCENCSPNSHLNQTKNKFRVLLENIDKGV